MLGDLFGWYLNSLAGFWGFALRIGLPQILLAIVLIAWLRRKGCFKGCCRVWSCGWCGEDSRGDRRAAPDGCCCGGPCCRRETETASEGGEDGEDV